MSNTFNTSPTTTPPTAQPFEGGQAGGVYLPGSAAVPAFHVQAIANSAFVLLARVTDLNGYPLLSEDITSIALVVYDVVNGIEIGSQDLTAASVVSDTLTLDGRWNVDQVGYNLAVPVPATVITAPGNYSAQVTTTLTNQTVIKTVWEIQVPA